VDLVIVNVAHYLKQMLFMLALLDPTVTLTEVNNMTLPEIELITAEHFVNNICTCECKVNVLYGSFYLDSDNNTNLMMTTPDGLNIPWGHVYTDALVIHELTHLVQYEHNQWGGLHSGSLLTLSDEEVEEIRIRNERLAYENQNAYLKLYNMPQINIDDRLAWSVAMSEGCDGEGRLSDDFNLTLEDQ
jgi:hypothetical protein